MLSAPSEFNDGQAVWAFAEIYNYKNTDIIIPIYKKYTGYHQGLGLWLLLWITHLLYKYI